MKFYIQPTIANDFKSVCETSGVSMASVITKFMCNYSAHTPVDVQEKRPEKSTTRRLRRKKMHAVIDTVAEILELEFGTLDRIPENFRDADTYAETERIVDALETVLESLNEVYNVR